MHFSQRIYSHSSLLLTFAEVLFPKKLIWIAGWFPSNQDPLSGNFVLRHAQAVAGNLSTNSAFDPKLTVFHFPIYRSKQNIPDPYSDANVEWRPVHSNYAISASKTTVFLSDSVASNGTFKTESQDNVESKNDRESEIELIWTPIKQFSGVLSKPLNAIWYWLVVFAVLVNYYRKNSDKECYLHLHAGDKIAWPLGFVKKHFWSKAYLWYTEHWAIFGNDIQDSYYQRSVFFRWYMKRIWKISDVSASISLFTHQQLQHTYKLPKRMHLFRNPVDTSIFKVNPAINQNLVRRLLAMSSDSEMDEKKINWLHVSNFDNRKQVPLIINAFNQISANNKDIPMNLILVGGDSSELLAKNPDIDINSVKSNSRIKIVGKVSPEELSDLMNLSSALILFSIAENAPCIIAEAQCCGLPIITSSVAGIPEMIVSKGVWFTKGLKEENLVETMEQYLKETKQEGSVNSTNHRLLARDEKYAARDEIYNEQMVEVETAQKRFNPDTIGQEILFAYLRYTPYC